MRDELTENAMIDMGAEERVETDEGAGGGHDWIIILSWILIIHQYEYAPSTLLGGPIGPPGLTFGLIVQFAGHGEEDGMDNLTKDR